MASLTEYMTTLEGTIHEHCEAGSLDAWRAQEAEWTAKAKRMEDHPNLECPYEPQAELGEISEYLNQLS